MSEGSFWKPGGRKPNKNTANQSVASKSQIGRKNLSPVRKADQEAPATQPSSATRTVGSKITPLRKTKLSGTTMNMRFMLRKQHPQDAEAATSNEAAATTAIMPMDVDGATDNKKATTQPQIEERPSVSRVHGEETVFLNVLGRRSFGGFNRHAEHAWTEHTAFYGSLLQRKGSSDAKKKRKRLAK